MPVNGIRWRCTILPALATGRQKSEREIIRIFREPTPTDLQDIVMACFPKYFKPMTEVYRNKK